MSPASMHAKTSTAKLASWRAADTPLFAVSK
jgi:hypothetical protein